MLKNKLSDRPRTYDINLYMQLANMSCTYVCEYNRCESAKEIPGSEA